MSDLPGSYFLNGVELLEFRREPILAAPGEVKPKKKKRKKPKPILIPDSRDRLIERDGLQCHYCEDDMELNRHDRKRGPNAISIEHVYPRSLGGSNQLFNLVLAHADCNNVRGNEVDKCDCPFCKEALRRRGR